MGIGRRDYTWGFLNEAATEGRFSISFLGKFNVQVEAGTSFTSYSYTVPEDYRLGVIKIGISTESGITHEVLLLKNDVSQSACYFSGEYMFEYSESNPHYFSAGDKLSILIYNTDEIAAKFKGFIVGVLETLI